MESLLTIFALYGVIRTLRYSFQEGQILAIWGRVLASVPIWAAKPLGDCLVCFSFWLSLTYSVLFGVDLFLTVGGVMALVFLAND